jgi:hypothetical protein
MTERLGAVLSAGGFSEPDIAVGEGNVISCVVEPEGR